MDPQTPAPDEPASEEERHAAIFAAVFRHNPLLVARPSVHVVAKTLLDRRGLERFIEEAELDWRGTVTWVPPHPDNGNVGMIVNHLPEMGEWAQFPKLVELAGRVCYQSFGESQSAKTTAEYIENILRHKHGSVLEHASITFHIAGVSRTLTHELVRHRVGVAISQMSQRFVNDAASLRFVAPPALLALASDGNSNPLTRFAHQARAAVERYTEAYETYSQRLAAAYPTWSLLARRKAAAEAARSVLPGCTETRLVWTVNMRALRAFLVKRGNAGADAEIRRLAVMLAGHASTYAADFFPDLHVEPYEDGVPVVQLDYDVV